MVEVTLLSRTKASIKHLSLCQDHTISINKLRCRLTSAADSRNPIDPMAYHTTYEFLKQRTEKGFNIAVRPINTHDQGGIQSLLHDKARTKIEAHLYLNML